MAGIDDLAQRLTRLSAPQILELLGLGPIGLEEYIARLGLGLVPALHHRLIIDRLEKVERGEISKLMLLMPPGAGKSYYASVIFPSWYLGRHPTHSVITASHTGELSERFGRRCRNLYNSLEHRKAFGVGVAGDSGAAGRWDTSRGGEFFAVGLGAAVLGRRADLAVLDDLVRSREDADSERIRDRTWDWYINDLQTRLKPGAKTVFIQTRWHEDDLAGRLLQMEGSRWTVVSLPMEAGLNDPLGRQPGERLWPEWFTEEMVTDAKRDSRAWAALYQQEPASEDGDYFQRGWFRDYDVTPQHLAVYAASDYAVTERAGDFTEHGIFGIDHNKNVYVLDWWSGQATADVWIEAQVGMIQRWKPNRWFGEAGPIRRAIEPFLKKRMDERGAHCWLEWLPSIHDKGTRCRAFQALCANQKVFLPVAAEWRSELVGQLLRFPAGMHDDKVDAVSLIGRGLESIRAPETNLGELQVHANLGYGHLKPRWSRFRAHPTPAADAGLIQFPELSQAQMHEKFIVELAAAARPQRRR